MREIVLNYNDFVAFLEATLPESFDYGRKSPNESVNINDADGQAILVAGLPSARSERLVQAMNETALYLDLVTWDEYADEPATSDPLWVSRYGVVNSRQVSDQLGTITLKPLATLFHDVLNSLALGPRAVREEYVFRTKQKTVDAAMPDAPSQGRREAIRQLSLDARDQAPEVAADLAAGRIRFLLIGSRILSEYGPNAGGITVIDTPSGVLVPRYSGRLFSSGVDMAVVPTWSVWNNITTMLPNRVTLEMWKALAIESGFAAND